MAKWHEEKAEQEIREMAKLIQEKVKEQMEDEVKGLKKIARRLDKQPAKPLTYVRRNKPGPSGQPKGTYATYPMEVDRIVQEAWGDLRRKLRKHL